MRLAMIALVTVLGFGAATLSCATPYSNKPERLKKPRKKKRPEPTQEEAAQAAPVLDEKCRTNFFANPTTVRKTRLGQQLAKEADGLLAEADDQEGQVRISTVKDALGKLTSALKADPYGAEPTYKMAVAYAMVGKKGCALALLDRLQQLSKHPDYTDEAERVINRALRDQSFDIFRKEADQALGR